MQRLSPHGYYNLICVCLCCYKQTAGYGVSTNEQGERNVSVHTARWRNVLPSFMVLALCQRNCTLTKPVLFETLVINVFTGAERAVIFFLLFWLKSILFISATMTKTKINCFHISGVGSQPHRNTRTSVLVLHTFFSLSLFFFFLHTVRRVPDQNESAWIKMRLV